MSVCIACGLGEDVNGDGYVDLDPRGGLECNGGPGNGVPTPGRGISINNSPDICRSLYIDSNGVVHERRKRGWFHAFQLSPSGSISAGGSSGTALINIDNRASNGYGCDQLAYAWQITCEVSVQVSGSLSATIQYRVDSGSWVDFQNIVLAAPCTLPITTQALGSVVNPGSTQQLEARVVLGPTSSTAAYAAVGLSVWGDYNSSIDPA